MGLKPFEYYCLTDWEFAFMVEGYRKRCEVELWGVRQISYPMWFQNAKDVPKIADYIPIPRFDKRKKNLAEREWSKEEIIKVFGEYYEA